MTSDRVALPGRYNGALVTCTAALDRYASALVGADHDAPLGGIDGADVSRFGAQLSVINAAMLQLQRLGFQVIATFFHGLPGHFQRLVPESAPFEARRTT